MDKLIRTVFQWPKTIIVLILLLSVPFTYAFFQKSFLNHVSIYFDQNDPSMIAYEEFQKMYGNEEIALIVVHADNLFTSRNLDIIRRISDMAGSTPGVQRVLSLTEETEIIGQDDMVAFPPLIPKEPLDPEALQELRRHVLQKEVFTQTLISEDGTTTAILLELEPIPSYGEKGRLLTNIRAQAETIAGGDVKLHFSGTPYVEYEIDSLTQKDDRKFTPITIFVIFLLTALFLRSVLFSILSMLNIFLALVWAVGIFVLTGETFNMVTVIMSPMILAIAVADSIHILSHFRTLHASSGENRRQVVLATASKLWLPCLFTSLTTGVGFLSFVATTIGPLRTLGTYTFIGVMLAFIMTIFVLPALLLVIRFKAPKGGAAGPQSRRSLESKDWLALLLDYISSLTIKYYKPVSIFFLLVIVVALAGAFQIKYETNFANHLSENNQIKKDVRFIEEHLSGTIPVVLLIRANSPDKDFTHPESLELLDTIETSLKQEFTESYTSFFSVIDYFKEMHRAFNPDKAVLADVPDNRTDILDYFELGEAEKLEHIVSTDRMEARISFNAFLGPIEKSKKLDRYLKSHVQQIIGGDYSYQVTGTSSLYVAMDRNLQKCQIRSGAFAILIIFFMMLVICKNLKLTLISMLPNLFPIVCTFGLMGFLDIPLDVATIMIAGITIGIAVDDTIHFLVWYRRNVLAGMEIKAALLKTYQDTGKPILTTSIILSVSFFIFVTGSVKPVQAFGMLAGLSMLFAVIADLFMFPAVILLFKPSLAPQKRKAFEVEYPAVPGQYAEPVARYGTDLTDS